MNDLTNFEAQVVDEEAIRASIPGSAGETPSTETTIFVSEDSADHVSIDDGQTYSGD